MEMKKQREFDPKIPFTFRVELRSIWDGDTIRVDIDRGHGLIDTGENGKGCKVRFAHIDAPEKQNYGSRKVTANEIILGKQAKEFLKDLIVGKQLIMESLKSITKGKYGRYVSILWMEQEDGSWLNVNQKMLDEGHASLVNY